MPEHTRITWRRRITGKHRQAGRLRTITRHPEQPERFTVAVVTERSGNTRTLDTATYEIHVGPGEGIPLDRWANTTAPLFALETTR
jgi:hypothetical protein